MDALRVKANVLVALYTPGYFNTKPGKKCYCGREITQFLRRGRCNVVPVLWVANTEKPDLMIPPNLRTDISWTIGQDVAKKNDKLSQETISQYESAGLQGIWANAGKDDKDGIRRRIATDLALRIIRYAGTPPPILTGPVDMTTEDCAFHPGTRNVCELPRLTEAAPEEIPGRKTLTLVFVDEDQLSAEVQDLIVSTGQGNVRAGQGIGYLNAYGWSLSDGIDEFRRISKKNPSVVIVARSSCLSDPSVRMSLAELIDPKDSGERPWVGGILALDSDPGLPDSSHVIIRTAQASEQDLRRQLSDLYTEIPGLLQRFGPTQVQGGRSLTRM
jgi:hypothetical protein